MKISKLVAAISLAAPLAVASTVTQAEEPFLIAPEMGKINFDARVRYEDVNDDSAKKDAEAFTLRVRLGYLTPDFKGFKGFAEVESTTRLGDPDYNDLRGQGGAYSVIADPDNNELNRGWVSYSGIDSTNIKLGRQRVILDNARFVGNVGWRQNEQTFDALTIANTSFADTTIVAGFMDDVHKIDGTHEDADIPLLNVKYTGLPFGDISGYGYFMDYDDKGIADRDTVGLRFNGSTKVSNSVNMLYTAEYAQQDIDFAGASSEDVNYYMVEAGVSIAGITAKIAHEVQEGEGTKDASFKTPLGTNHAFNGWADQFLNTPDDGLEDTFVTLSTKFMGMKFVAAYHNFEAENSSTDYGDEMDFLVVKKFNKNFKALVKYASYSQGDSATKQEDKDKLWIQGELSF